MVGRWVGFVRGFVWLDWRVRVGERAAGRTLRWWRRSQGRTWARQVQGTLGWVERNGGQTALDALAERAE